MDKVIRSFIVLFVLLIAITGYHKSYDQSHNASTINNLKENIFYFISCKNEFMFNMNSFGI